MTIEPDTKNWTWVLERPCPECGFDAAVRGQPGRWSDHEYGCHVRDVFDRFAARFQLMRDETDPAFENWDQDETAVTERYGEQDPTVVATELAAAGERLATLLGDIRADELGRTGRRSDGARFTVRLPAGQLAGAAT